MSDKNKKSSLEEAMLDFANIQKFAEEQAAAQIKEQVSEKLKNLFEEKLNEDITITISGDGVAVEDGAKMTDLDGGIENHIDMPATDMGLENPVDMDGDEFSVSDEDDEISIEEPIDEIIQNENMEEMTNMPMEQEVAPAAAPAAPAVDAVPVADAAAPATEDMTEETPGIPEMISKLDTLINIMMQQQGGEAAGTPGEEDFEVIDDEAGAAPVAGAAPAAPAAMPPQAPMQEEEIEITDFEGDGEHKDFIDEMENEMIEIVDEDEIPMEGMSMEETRTLGFASKGTGNRTLKKDTMKDEKGHHAPVTSLKENKAHKESNVDELIKENNSLKNTVKELQGDRKEFEDAFRELRKQFNEMQTFNGKLALVNKVLMNGGLTTDEKIKICEQFDQTETFEEANKLFKSIIKENNIKVSNNVADKLKSTSTNTAKPKSTSEPLYESDEAKRLKRLAGIIKSEDEN
jgi:hypothetical protein